MNGPGEIAASEMCARVKRLGYAAGNQIHVYRERLEVVSDPFLHDKGTAVRVRAENGASIRIIRLPSTILQAVKNSVMSLGHR
jgi:hypothetical protein